MQTQNSSTPAGGRKKTPDFEIIYAIVCLLVVLLHKRNQIAGGHSTSKWRVCFGPPAGVLKS